jgi:tetratricopeptide (TPR) repeat protein
LLVISLAFVVRANAQTVRYDSTVNAGIKQIYGIKFPEAEKTFKSLIADYPNKPAGKFFYAMIDWWKIILDPDNESYDDIFYQKLNNVIDQCDKNLDKDPKNVDALFFNGGAIGFRGRLHAYRESWLKAADDGREALPLVQRAAKLDPGNVDVKLGFGIYNYYVAVLPDKYPALKPIMLFFPGGNKKRGIEDLEYVARDGKYAKYEARYFLMNIFYHYENNFNEAEKYAKMLNSDFPDNPSFERWLGRIYAKQGKSILSSVIFLDVLKKNKQGFTGYTYLSVKREADYYVAYQLKLEGKLDSARIYFKDCVDLSLKMNEEDSGFLANSYLYLGMIYDASNERAKAVGYYNKVLDMKEFKNSQDLAEQYLKNPYKQ